MSLVRIKTRTIVAYRRRGVDEHQQVVLTDEAATTFCKLACERRVTEVLYLVRCRPRRTAAVERIANMAGTDLEGGILPLDIEGGIDRTSKPWWRANR